MPEFSYPGWTLEDAVDALRAFDGGATDSGVNDPALKQAVVDYFKQLTPDARREVVAWLSRSLLTDHLIANGYGLADVVSLAEWLESIGVDF